MSFLSWLLSDGDRSEDHQERVKEAKKKLEKAEATHQEVQELIAELDHERRRNHYAEMIAGSLMPRMPK